MMDDANLGARIMAASGGARSTSEYDGKLYYRTATRILVELTTTKTTSDMRMLTAESTKDRGDVQFASTLLITDQKIVPSAKLITN